MSEQTKSREELMAAEWAESIGRQADAAPGPSPKPRAAREASVARAPLEDLRADPAVPPREVSLDAILDIPVSLSMEIGRTKINIRHLLQLNQGSVVELDRLAGEPLDVLVNGTLIAHGEVVVVNEKFGIRLTDVVSAHERVQKLR